MSVRNLGWAVRSIAKDWRGKERDWSLELTSTERKRRVKERFKFFESTSKDIKWRRLK